MRAFRGDDGAIERTDAGVRVIPVKVWKPTEVPRYGRGMGEKAAGDKAAAADAGLTRYVIIGVVIGMLAGPVLGMLVPSIGVGFGISIGLFVGIVGAVIAWFVVRPKK